MNVYNADDLMVATMEANIDYPDKDKEEDGFCKQILSFMGAISGVIPGVGGPASGLFGFGGEAFCK